MVETPTLVGLPARYDVRVNRFTVGVNGVATVLKADPARWSFIAVASTANGVMTIDNPGTPGVGLGFTVPIAAPFFSMTVRDFPGLVQRAWFWGPVNGGGTITVYEVFIVR